MTDALKLDLTGFLPQEIELTLGEEVIKVSSDPPPSVVIKAADWRRRFYGALATPDNPVDMEEGWEIAAELCGQDMRKIGSTGLVALLSFFQKLMTTNLQDISWILPLESQESSTEQSPSENSSEVDSSSEPPPTS